MKYYSCIRIDIHRHIWYREEKNSVRYKLRFLPTTLFILNLRREISVDKEHVSTTNPVNVTWISVESAVNVTCTTDGYSWLTIRLAGLNNEINQQNLFPDFPGILRKCSISRSHNINRNIDRNINHNIRPNNSDPRIQPRRLKAEFKVVRHPSIPMPG